MPITSVKIEATSAEEVKTFFIRNYEGRVIFVQTTSAKINALLDIIGDLGTEIDDWGELKDYNGIYAL